MKVVVRTLTEEITFPEGTHVLDVDTKFGYDEHGIFTIVGLKVCLLSPALPKCVSKEHLVEEMYVDRLAGEIVGPIARLRLTQILDSSWFVTVRIFH